MGIFNWFKTDDPLVPASPSKQIDTKDPDIQYLEAVLQDWLDGKVRKEQLLAEKYYDGDQDILRREKKVIGSDGQLIKLDNVANNRLVDNQYKKLVDQKTNYVLGKPITIACDDDKYLELLNKIFSPKVHRQLRTLAENAVNESIAWLYPYYNENKEFKFAVFPGSEVCPMWHDKSHTELDGVMRYYTKNVFTNNTKAPITENHVELYTTYGIEHFLYQGASLKFLEHMDYMVCDGQPCNWDRLPMIPFKYNDKEIPLIRNVKGLQDALNQVLSDFQNNMEEDPRTSILVLKNYDGTNIADFRQNLATYGVIKVTTVDGVQGGVDTLKVEVNAANYQAIMMQLKRALVENGRGFDAKEERMDGDPNQMNIESMYTDIDLDVNGMEIEFQAGFEELKWFIDHHLMHMGEKDYSDTDATFIFNRDIFINEDAKIANCVASEGILSKKTILANHPWVTSVPNEIKQLEQDQVDELDEMAQTLKVQSENTPTPPKQEGGDA